MQQLDLYVAGYTTATTATTTATTAAAAYIILATTWHIVATAIGIDYTVVVVVADYTVADWLLLVPLMDIELKVLLVVVVDSMKMDLSLNFASVVVVVVARIVTVANNTTADRSSK